MEFQWFSEDFRGLKAHILRPSRKEVFMSAVVMCTAGRCIRVTMPAAGVIWLLTGAPAFGQSFGASVGGVVTDETHGVLPGVTVTIRHVANGRTIALTTEEQGDYRAVALQPGDYQFVVERSGFMPETRL